MRDDVGARRTFLLRRSPTKQIKMNCPKCSSNYIRNGNGFRAIERITKVNHNTVIRWVKQAANQLPDRKSESRMPQVGQLDELQTYIGKKASA